MRGCGVRRLAAALNNAAHAGQAPVLHKRRLVWSQGARPGLTEAGYNTPQEEAGSVPRRASRPRRGRLQSCSRSQGLRYDGGPQWVIDVDRDRFVPLWDGLARKLGIGDEPRSAVGRELVEAYSSEDRHYHGVSHILTMLDAIERFEARFQDPDAARLAAFFHDVVYLPGRTDNEQRSAERLASLLAEVEDAQVIDRACELIMATGEHRMSGNPSVDLFIDVDMSILAASWPEYSKYAEGVMREYTPASGDQAYRKGRVELFLNPILARGSVFVTSTYAPLDAAAMTNLATEREILASGGRFDVL
ncbi:hypothetical protein BSF38_04892 [Paludisphaera borealis]|uniref:HD domain-containing protein n=2 Tax=Paludisphaera borealis TaxID=1387353 RepID=A0A1U7CWQ5_9BACT|nr:hypothetical protein BSF38_04892 [Paludisphaera borealis]